MRLLMEKRDSEFGTLFTLQFRNKEDYNFFDTCINNASVGTPQGMKERIEIVQTIMHQRMRDNDIQSLLNSDEDYKIQIPLSDTEFGNLMFLSFMAISAKYDNIIDDLIDTTIPGQKEREYV